MSFSSTVGRLLVVLALAGCPAPGGGDGGTGGGAPLTFDQYCAANCSGVERCGVFETTAGCEAFLSRPNVFTQCELLRPSVKDDRIAFDGAAAGRCAEEAMTSASCTQTLPSSCQEIFSGRVGLDGGCYRPEDCVTGTYCETMVSPPPVQKVCPGRCLARVGAGTVVNSSAACLENLGARFVGDGGRFALVCEPLAALGEPCGGFQGDYCRAGQFCNEGVCEAQHGANAVCPSDDGGLSSALVENVFCEPSLRCQPDGTGRRICAALAALGQRCGWCRLDLRCVAADGGGVCAPLGLPGESCNGYYDCREDLFCSGVCAAPAGLGASCIPISLGSCLAGLRCGQVAPADGGFILENRCEADDGGGLGLCVDPTP